jgi:hypothetical protein
VDQGIAALVGVVIGGVLTAALDDVRERGRERREALAAVRILDTDLVYIVSVLEPVAKGGRWFAPPQGFQLSEWSAQRGAIARWRGLHPDEWTAIAQAFDTTAQLERHLPDVAVEGESLNAPLRGLFEVTWERAKLGLGACRHIQRRLTRRQWPRWLKRRRKEANT